MSEADEPSLRAKLRSLPLPELGEGKVLEQVLTLEHFALDEEKLFLVLLMPNEAAAYAKALEQRITKALSPMLAKRRLALVLTAEGEAAQKKQQQQKQQQQKKTRAGGLAEVACVIAVASGKGGVGKSTLAVNVALACAQSGLRTGLLDADLYGPSLVRMLGLNQPPQRSAEGLLIPEQRFGIKTLSMGAMLAEEKALIWRGPLIARALKQMLQGADWQHLDLLLLDLPPGTGDLPLSLAQSAALDGALLISTPQQVALYDVRKSRNMFETLGVPIVGMVENMSGFLCPHCGMESVIFGKGGCEQEARRVAVPFLGRLPLSIALQQSGEQGVPLMAAREEQEKVQILLKQRQDEDQDEDKETPELAQLRHGFRTIAGSLRDWAITNRFVAES